MHALSRTLRAQGQLHMATKNPLFTGAHGGREARGAVRSRRRCSPGAGACPASVQPRGRGDTMLFPQGLGQYLENAAFSRDHRNGRQESTSPLTCYQSCSAFVRHVVRKLLHSSQDPRSTRASHNRKLPSTVSSKGLRQ